MQKNKEKLGIYNVTFNDKKATPIKAEVELIEDAVIDFVLHYIKGWHNKKRDKGRGAVHIKLHLENNSQGQIYHSELLEIGNSIRNYLNNFKQPFKDKNNASIYEWQDKNGVRFRVVSDKNHSMISKGEGHSNTPLSPFDETIITFYSDRNINQRMEFKNPLVKAHYELIEKQQQILKENKHMEK